LIVDGRATENAGIENAAQSNLRGRGVENVVLENALSVSVSGVKTGTKPCCKERGRQSKPRHGVCVEEGPIDCTHALNVHVQCTNGRFAMDQ